MPAWVLCTTLSEIFQLSTLPPRSGGNYCFNVPQIALGCSGLVDVKTEWWAFAKWSALNLPAPPPPQATEAILSTQTTWPITEQWASAMEDGEGGEVKEQKKKVQGGNRQTRWSHKDWSRSANGKEHKLKTLICFTLASQKICGALPGDHAACHRPISPFQQESHWNKAAHRLTHEVTLKQKLLDIFNCIFNRNVHSHKEPQQFRCTVW